jgi:NAD(P)-dependent dehydrogenase (short-subunit alcohol dehydrogenase family)
LDSRIRSSPHRKGRGFGAGRRVGGVAKIRDVRKKIIKNNSVYMRTRQKSQGGISRGPGAFRKARMTQGFAWLDSRGKKANGLRGSSLSKEGEMSGTGGEWSGKGVVVTGGAQGIGHAVTRAFCQAGAFVALWDADETALAWAGEELSVVGRVLPVRCDVSSEEEISRAACKTLDAFGNVAALVCNAGIMQRSPIGETSLTQWNRVIGVNLTGAWLCVRALVEPLRAASGAVVTIASTRAFQSEPDTEAYAASKGGLTALTHSLAVSLGPEVRVNCIAPGWVDVSRLGKPGGRVPETLRPEDHAQHPAGRVGRPEDVAELALFLCSGKAGFMTGETVVLDGGMTRRMLYLE